MDMVFKAETANLEYKREFTKNILKTISAYANYHDGELIIGIDDDLNIVGVNDVISLKHKLENSINDTISPKPYYEITEKSINDKIVIIIKVYHGENTPYLYDNKAYKRMDTSTIVVDRYDYENLILNGRNQGYDEVFTKEDALEFDYLNKKLREKLGLNMISPDILKTLGLIRNEKYTNAAALISDNNPVSSSGISLIRFEGNNVANIKDRIYLNNISILEMFDKSVDFYHKHINTTEIIKAAYRKTVEQVPFIAYREAIANAIVHRDYTIKAENRIEIYDDRIEIVSPGGLPIGITEDEYLDGRISVSRNKVISDIFFRFGIIERLATGVRRIKEYYRDYTVKPKFFITANSIKVILPFVTINNLNSERVNEYANEYDIDLTDSERIIIEYIKLNNHISRIETEKLLDLKKTYTVKVINELIAKGIIRKIGMGKNTKYVFVEK